MSSAPSSARPDPVTAALDRAAAAVLDAVVTVAAGNPVVLIDGRSGAGKSTLARMIVSRWPTKGRVQLVALDSMYPGWDGLFEGAAVARELILTPHAKGIVGVWQRWDWDVEGWAEAHAVDPSLPLIVEGSGILSAATARLADVCVWLDAPEHSRRLRALSRDGDLFRPHWARWAEQEERHLSRDDPAALATLTFAVP